MTVKMTEDWIRVCALDDIPVPGARVLRRPAGPDVALFRTAADRVFALVDRCPHKGGALSQGMVFGERVACPLHGWVIELATGSAVAPDEGCAMRVPVHMIGDDVFVDFAAITVRATSVVEP
ncbi:MAG TPA: nitrite reductase (NAD(P)H) small subunit [Burkholderiales bacterium]|jgi:nitrite reductase (NADH) small subunit|nr:nitrite reductase (NAD(P)H) small subunit [Burkholderiales bacterium]